MIGAAGKKIGSAEFVCQGLSQERLDSPKEHHGVSGGQTIRLNLLIVIFPWECLNV